MRNEKEVKELYEKAKNEFDYVKEKLDAFMDVEKLSKLAKDYYILKGWIECFYWILGEKDGRKTR